MRPRADQRRRPAARLLLVALATALATLPASAQQASRGWSASSAPAIRVFNLAGATRVVGWDRDSVAVAGTVSAGGRLYGGGSRSAIKLGVEPGVPGADAPAARLEVRVPRGATVAVKSASADVTIAGLTGAVEVSSVSGTVTLTGDPRQVSVESMEGAVDLRTGAPVVRVRTAGAAATVDGPVHDLRVESVSGAIVVHGADARQARLESVTGPIRYEGALTRDGVLDVQTHESAVTLILPAGLGAAFDLTTFDGLLINRFGSAAARPSRGGKPLRFTANGGGARVTVRTLKGDVAVYRR